MWAKRRSNSVRLIVLLINKLESKMFIVVCFSVNKSGSRDKPKFRHVNLGPSMFPFLYDSSKFMSNQQKVICT